MIEFRVNREKAINSLLFLIGEANSRGKNPTQYDLVKATFLADRAHLNKYGRPVTFDKYVAMEHGPVPSFVYDALKPGFNWAVVGRDRAPWGTDARNRAHYFYLIDFRADAKKLSASDCECLSDAIRNVLSLTFQQIRRLTHEDRAYVDAWRDEEGVHAFPINMELLLDDQSDEAIDDLRYLAEMTAA